MSSVKGNKQGSRRITKLVVPYLQKLRGGGISAVLTRGAGEASIVYVLGFGVNFGVQILLAHLLGVSSYGVYIYAFTCLSILILPSKLGMDTSALRFVSAYHGRSEWGLLRGFLQRSTHIVLVTSTVTALATAGVVLLLEERLGRELVATFWIVCLILPFLTLLEVRGSSLQALKHVALGQAPKLVLRPLLLAIIVVLFSAIASRSLYAPVAMVADLLAIIGALLFVNRYRNRLLLAPLSTEEARYQTREWSKVGWSLLLVSGLLVVLNQTDIVMLGFYLGTTEAGIYATASRVATLTLFGIYIVNAIAAPMFSEFYSQGRMGELQNVIILAARGILAFSLPVSLVMFFFGDLVLGMFGPEFGRGYWALVILTVGQLVNASVGSVGFLMSMTGHQKEAARVFGGAAAVNVALNAGLIPLWGINGAAVATATTTVAWNVILALYVWKRLGMRATAI